MIESAQNERERLEAVHRYDILDTPPDGAFNRVTAIAAEIFDVPIALVTIVDEDRIWFKAKTGLDSVDEIPRSPGLCASAILQDSPYIVEEARKDPRTLANPLVAGKFGLQFYAASPLRTLDGHRLGTLCIIDREPRMFSPKQAAILEHLSDVVMDEMELRLAARRASAV
jgi:GAF domain-containing protein